MKYAMLFFRVLFLVMALNASAQKFVSERSTIIFFSSAAIEDITATNTKASSIINLTTSEVAYSVLIKEFKFEKKLMQQHFNEKYMESDKYPKSTFAGKLEGFDPSATMVQQVKAIGKLTIHGVTKEVIIPGTIEVSPTKILVKSKFMVKLADYKIEIPKLLWQNIAEQVEVTVEFIYKPQ
jgi:hypothetical protein